MIESLLRRKRRLAAFLLVDPTRQGIQKLAGSVIIASPQHVSSLVGQLKGIVRGKRVIYNNDAAGWLAREPCTPKSSSASGVLNRGRVTGKGVGSRELHE